MFAYPLGLLALLGIPVVLGLHLYRRRFRRQVVSALFLWEADEADPAAGQRREPLRRSASLLAELLAVLALGLAFAGLRGCDAERVDHLVIVLDSSASMAANPVSGNVLERARDLAGKRIESLASDGRVTLVRSGPRPEVLVGPAALRDEAAAALADFRPGRIHHDLQPAVALAEQLGASLPVLVVSDRSDHQLPPTIELQAVGDPASNLAIVAATRLPQAPGVDEVRISVTSYGGSQRSAQLQATWVQSNGTEERMEQVLDLAPGQTRSFSATISSDAGVVHAQLPEDALAIDNHAWLAPEPVRELRIGTTLQGEQLEALGLGANGSLDKWIQLVPESAQAPPGLAHLVLGDRPLDNPGSWSFALEAPVEDVRGTSLAGPFLVDRSTPLLRGVTLEGVVWTTASPEAPARLAPGLPLVSAGNRGLLVEFESGKDFAIDLDPGRSSLLRSPDWPILLANLAEMRRAALPGVARRNLVLGEPLTFLDDVPATYRLEGEGIALEAAAKGTLAWEDPGTPGTYTLLRRPVDSDGAFETVAEVTWSFVDSSESDLTRSSAGSSDPAHNAALQDGGASAASSRIELALVALALLFGLANWFFLAPRKRD